KNVANAVSTLKRCSHLGVSGLVMNTNSCSSSYQFLREERTKGRRRTPTSGTTRMPPYPPASAAQNHAANLTFKAKVHCFRLFRADSDLLILRSVLLLPRLDGVCSRRQALDGEIALVVAHREERVGADPDVSFHPGMDVALHGNHDFGPG